MLIKSKISFNNIFRCYKQTTNDEIEFVCASINGLTQNHSKRAFEYDYNKDANEFVKKQDAASNDERLKKWFCME